MVWTNTENGSRSYFNFSHLVAMINIAVHMWINLKIRYEFLIRLRMFVDKFKQKMTYIVLDV